MVELSKIQIQDELYKTMLFIHRFCEENKIRYYMIGGTALGAVRHGGFIPWDDDIDIAMRRSDYEKFLTCWEDNDKYFIQNYKNDRKSRHTLSRILICGTKIKLNNSENITPRNPNLFIDIFPLDEVPVDAKQREKQRKSLLKIKKLIGKKINTTSSSAIKHFVKVGIKFALFPVSFGWLVSKFDNIAMQYSGCRSGIICSMSSQYDYNRQAMDSEIYGDGTKMKFMDSEFYAPSQVDRYLNLLYGDYMKLPPEEKRVFHTIVYKEGEIQ